MYPTAIGFEPGHSAFDTQPSWQAVMIGQAFANGLFIAAVYRVGTEDLGGAVPAPVTFVCVQRGAVRRPCACSGGLLCGSMYAF